MANKSEPPPLTTVYGGPKLPGGTSVSCLFTWLGTKGDYASIEKKDKSLVGWRRQFSTITKEGRFNMVIATYLCVAVAGAVMWNKYKQKKKSAEAVALK